MKQITLIDDLDGTPDANPVTFSYNGKNYTIDLAQKNADKLAKALEPFLAKATEMTKAPKEPKTTGAKKDGTPKVSNMPDYNRDKFKVWAEANGKEYPAKGRTPYALIQEFLDATK